VSTDTTWRPFGVPGDEYDEAQGRAGIRVLNLTMRRPKRERTAVAARDSAATWLRSATVALGVLAAAAAAVSFAAQYKLVFAAKGLAWAAALEAGIPDAGSMVFACLGIALALKGRRAIRARALNVACVALSLAMNALAAKSGWRDMAVWVMPSAVYALASDTLIGVIRASVLASRGGTDGDRTMLDVFGGLLLWVLRLVLAPPSTLGGFRRWVVESCPVAPGRTAAVTAPIVAALPAAPETPGSAAIPTTAPVAETQVNDTGRPLAAPRGESKTGRFLALVKDRHGELAGIDPAKVARIAADLAPEVGLNVGAARSALRPRVLAANAGDQS
jgi:hypothetical protein